MVRKGPSCLDYTEPSSGISPCLVPLKVGVPQVWHSTSCLSAGIPFLPALQLSWITQEFPGGSCTWLCTVTSWPFLSWAILRVPSPTPCVTYTISSRAACSSHTDPHPCLLLLSCAPGRCSETCQVRSRPCLEKQAAQQPVMGSGQAAEDSEVQGAENHGSLTMVQRTHPSGKGLGFPWVPMALEFKSHFIP